MAKTPNQTDPVAEMGRRLAALYADLHRCDEAMIQRRGGTDEELLALATNHLGDGTDALLSQIAFAQCSSLEGLMSQIMVANDILNRLIESSEQTGGERLAFRAIKRILYSALSELAAETGIEPSTLGGDVLMPPAHDPYALMSAGDRAA